MDMTVVCNLYPNGWNVGCFQLYTAIHSIEIFLNYLTNEWWIPKNGCAGHEHFKLSAVFCYFTVRHSLPFLPSQQTYCQPHHHSKTGTQDTSKNQLSQSLMKPAATTRRSQSWPLKNQESLSHWATLMSHCPGTFHSDCGLYWDHILWDSGITLCSVWAFP